MLLPRRLKYAILAECLSFGCESIVGESPEGAINAPRKYCRTRRAAAAQSISTALRIPTLTMSTAATVSAGPSTPTTPSRKRSKWDDSDDGAKPTVPSNPLKKRLKPKTVTAAKPLSAIPVSESSGSRLKPPRNSLSHSRYVPPRTSHPPFLPSRSVYSYERLNQIEEGSYGVVFRARDKHTGDVVALKKLKLDEEKHGFPITALREINALIACRHENVVGIREVVVGDTLTQCVIYT